MPSIDIIVTCGDGVTTRITLPDRQEAEKAFAEELAAHPDSEVKMVAGDKVLVSAGPRRDWMWRRGRG